MTVVEATGYESVDISEQQQQQLWPRIAVSKLATSFYFNCEKHVKLTASTSVKAIKDSDIKTQHTTDAITEAHLQRGNQFEINLLEALGQDTVVDHTHTPTSKSRQVLREAKVGQILYQLSFEMPESFYADGRCYRLQRFIPDFLWIKEDLSTKKRTIFVIDAKSSRHMGSYHQFQVASYAYLLEYIIKDIRSLQIDSVGGVWLPSNLKEPETFRIDLMMPKMKFFYTIELPAIIQSDHPQWLYNTKCKTCDYTDICRRETYGTPGAVAYMTDAKIKALRDTKTNSNTESTAAKNTTVNNDMDDIVNRLQGLNTDDKDPVDIEDLTNQLEGVKIKDRHVPVPEWMLEPEFLPYIQAYKTKKPQFRGNYTVTLSETVDHDIFISFAYDPMYRRICAYSIRAFTSAGDIVKDLDCVASVAYHGRLLADYLKVAKSLVKHLVSALTYMEAKNSRCTLYVANHQAKTQLRKCLLETASSQEEGDHEESIIQDAMKCLLVLFQDTQLLNIPGMASFPTKFEKVTVPRLVDMERIVQENIALGVPGFYTLTDILHWMCNAADKEIGDEKDDISGYLLDEAGLYDRWLEQEDASNSSYLFAHTQQLREILNQYRRLATKYKEDTLTNIYCLESTCFVWPDIQPFHSRLLGRLAFFKKLECISGCENVRSERLSDLGSAFGKSSLRIQYQRTERIINLDGKDTWIKWFDVIPDRASTWTATRIQMDMLVRNGLKEYIVVDDNRQGILQAIQYNDLMDRNKMFRIQGITTVDVDRVADCGFSIGLTGYLVDLNLKKGKYYRIYKRFIDFNTDKILDALVQIDQGKETSPFEHMIQDPNNWAEETQDGETEGTESPFSSDARATALKLRDDFKMSPSQKDISANIIKKRLQIVWGPPGSGKTEFLALFINWYITHLHHNKNGKPFIIGITAFTRHAILNLLKRIALIQTRHPASKNLFKIVYMVSSSGNTDIDGLEGAIHCKADKVSNHLPTDGAVVVGGTVWDWHKVQKKRKLKLTCDMMIIDESSQLLVPDAALAINCLDAKMGRLIIAGDHMQLGPILQNTYPKLPPNEPLLFGSIQQCLMRTEANLSIPPQDFLLKKGAKHNFGPNTIQLKDNWRMNDELNSFFRQIYGNDLAAHYPNLCLKHDWARVTPTEKLDTIRSILDPKKAMTVVNVKFTTKKVNLGEETEKEANIIADIVETHLSARINRQEEKDPDGVKVMIVTPHHRQRVAVEHALSRKMDATLCKKVIVNTVEKMQGQECELVLACFTFNEITRAKIDFLLDFKRWNVTVSRARCKVIIITTDNILALPNQQGNHALDLFEKRESAEGWGFVCMVQEWALHSDAIIDWIL